MITDIINKIKSFHKGDKGAVLIFVGLTLLPMLLMLGLAVDSSFGLAEKRKLQMAVDAAAKAGATNGGGITATITAEAQKVFSINTTNMSGITGPNVSVNNATKTVNVSASVAVNNVFMTLGGIPTSTYNASATAVTGSSNLAEIAIVYEVSSRFADNNFHQNICNALINFVNTLPSNVMVSITPIATDLLLDSSTTVQNALFNHLSMTTNDESANPGFYPMSSGLAWTSTNYAAVTNPFYTSGDYESSLTPTTLLSYSASGTCTIPSPTYASCSPIIYPLKCPSTKTSCTQAYSHHSSATFRTLPLTANKTLIVNYITALKSFTASSDGFFPSLISWGWRTIDPAWNDFWMTNSDTASTLRTTGSYPKPYGGKQKSMILIFNGDKYWDDYSSNISFYYSNFCGDVTGGINHWYLTAYGMVATPTDYKSKMNDITCENRWYKPMDKGLGLNLSDSTNYNSTVSSSTFPTSILNEVSAKFFRICSNIKAQNIDVYLLANNNTSTLTPCCNTSANAFTIGNSSTSISTALSSVQSKITAKIS